MSNVSHISNRLWQLGSLPGARRFYRGLAEPDRTQRELLLAIVRRNRDTVFGREHGFERIDSIAAWRRRVPVRGWEEFAPLVERMAAGEERVLTADRVRLFEPTGGSGGGTKLIPYTRALRREFGAALAPWIRDIFRQVPQAPRGTSYWSISPLTEGERRTPGGTPIGFEDDAGYLGWLGGLARAAFAVPESVRWLAVDQFRLATAWHLLRDRELSLISVWNPSFLLLILEELEARHEELQRAVRDGDTTALGFATPRLKSDKERAVEIERAFRLEAAERYRALWPHLGLISCWLDGPSRLQSQPLQERFSGVRFQGKGLIATEGIVSLPLYDAGGAVPAITSHFLEFLPGGDPAFPRLAGELEAGTEYTVLLTTGGGLYRYNLGDVVEVTGHWRGLPLLRFRGRERVSDLVGEKLAEVQVERVLTDAAASCGIQARFAMLVPVEREQRWGYLLLLETTEAPGSRLQACLAEIERGLRENFHYNLARELGQLRELACWRLTENAADLYTRRCQAEGQRPGDIKARALDPRPDWPAWLEQQGAIREEYTLAE